MRKISANSNLTRLFSLVISVLPLLVIIIINLIFHNQKVFFTIGYGLFFLSYLSVLIIHLQINFFDYDVFVNSDSLFFKRPFKKIIEENKNLVTIESLGILSVFFLLFKFEVGERKYLVKLTSQDRFNPNKKIDGVLKIIQNTPPLLPQVEK